MALLDLINQITSGSASPERHFDEIAANAPKDALSAGIADAFRSDNTPSMGDMVGNLFGNSDPQQRAGLLNQILATVGSLTGVFFLVMVALSSVALLVGGIGVMAIMMVSVTDRTREIGTRKALGATRRMVLWQFLVEAATPTLAGGIIGIAFGLLTGEVLKRVLAIEASVPVWSALLACGVSVVIGLVFGVIPANRAAKMDPVEALRHE